MKTFITISLMVGVILTSCFTFAQATTNETQQITPSPQVLKNRKMAKEIKAKHTKSERSKKNLKRSRWDMLQPKVFSREWADQQKAKKMEREGKDTKELWKSHKKNMKNRRGVMKQRKLEKMEKERIEKEKKEKLSV